MGHLKKHRHALKISEKLHFEIHHVMPLPGAHYKTVTLVEYIPSGIQRRQKLV